jgi:hypothetical protein
MKRSVNSQTTRLAQRGAKFGLSTAFCEDQVASEWSLPAGQGKQAEEPLIALYVPDTSEKRQSARKTRQRGKRSVQAREMQERMFTDAAGGAGAGVACVAGIAAHENDTTAVSSEHDEERDPNQRKSLTNLQRTWQTCDD